MLPALGASPAGAGGLTGVLPFLGAPPHVHLPAAISMCPSAFFQKEGSCFGQAHYRTEVLGKGPPTPKASTTDSSGGCINPPPPSAMWFALHCSPGSSNQTLVPSVAFGLTAPFISGLHRSIPALPPSQQSCTSQMNCPQFLVSSSAYRRSKPRTHSCCREETRSGACPRSFLPGMASSVAARLAPVTPLYPMVTWELSCTSLKLTTVCIHVCLHVSCIGSAMKTNSRIQPLL